MHTEQIAAALARAEDERTPLAPLSATYGLRSPADAYAVQQALLQRKLRAGGRVVGRKIGLTSAAMQRLLGVDEPDYGFLLDTMVVPDGAALSRAGFLAPRVEPEIGFWLAADLRGPGVTAADVLAATRGVSAAIELVDSRIADWKITLADTIADNASSARVVVSERVVPLTGLDLAAEAVTLRQNGAEVGQGSGAAVLGHPAAAVAWLANALAAYGELLRAGDLVLPGAMCAAVPAVGGDSFEAAFTSLGSVALRFEP